MNDVYHWPGSSGGHPSDVLMPIFAAAEYAQATGRDFITAVVLGYEIYLRMSDAVKTPGFDCANFCCMGAALDAGKLFGLNAENLSECLSMAVVPNNALNQARTGHLSRCGRRSPRGNRDGPACSRRCSRKRACKARTCR